jgi:hypothetical protein
MTDNAPAAESHEQNPIPDGADGRVGATFNSTAVVAITTLRWWSRLNRRCVSMRNSSNSTRRMLKCTAKSPGGTRAGERKRAAGRRATSFILIMCSLDARRIRYFQAQSVTRATVRIRGGLWVFTPMVRGIIAWSGGPYSRQWRPHASPRHTQYWVNERIIPE